MTLFITMVTRKLTQVLLIFMDTLIVLAEGVPPILSTRTGWRLDAAGCRRVLESAYFYFESKASPSH